MREAVRGGGMDSGGARGARGVAGGLCGRWDFGASQGGRGLRLAFPSAAGQGRCRGYPPLRDGGGAHPLTHARVSASLLGVSCLVARASWSVPSPAPDILCWARSRGRSSPPWLHRDCLPRLSCLRGCCERPSRPGVSPPGAAAAGQTCRPSCHLPATYIRCIPPFPPSHPSRFSFCAFLLSRRAPAGLVGEDVCGGDEGPPRRAVARVGRGRGGELPCIERHGR